MGGREDGKRKASRSGGRQGPGSQIDPEELALWKAIAGGVKPLGSKARRPVRHRPQSGVTEPEGAKTPNRRGSLPRAQPVPVAPNRPVAPPLGGPVPAGLDRKTAQRFTRGQLSIDAVLDLHGMTQGAAVKALDGFLAAAIAHGQRCLLVVTGKGRGGDGSGVLRRRLPAWLEASGHRRAILALAPARPQHGGSGAFYLLLRRQREDRSAPSKRQ